MQYPRTEYENNKMMSTPYTNGVGSIMYKIVFIKLELVYVISKVVYFMKKLG